MHWTSTCYTRPAPNLGSQKHHGPRAGPGLAGISCDANGWLREPQHKRPIEQQPRPLQIKKSAGNLKPSAQRECAEQLSSGVPTVQHSTHRYSQTSTDQPPPESIPSPGKPQRTWKTWARGYGFWSLLRIPGSSGWKELRRSSSPTHLPLAQAALSLWPGVQASQFTSHSQVSGNLAKRIKHPSAQRELNCQLSFQHQEHRGV